MDLPKIELSSLPDLDTLTGLFGSATQALPGMVADDTLLAVMVFVYEVIGQN